MNCKHSLAIKTSIEEITTHLESRLQGIRSTDPRSPHTNYALQIRRHPRDLSLSPGSRPTASSAVPVALIQYDGPRTISECRRNPERNRL